MTQKNIQLDLLTSPGCVHCKAFKDMWHEIEKGWPNVTYKETSVTTPEGQEMAGKYGIFSSPGIILNEEVWATGGFKRDEFLEKLKELSA
jgi:glutaredoxin